MSDSYITKERENLVNILIGSLLDDCQNKFSTRSKMICG